MEKTKKTAQRRTMEGTVAKLSGEKTIKIVVESKFQHIKYGKIVKSHRGYIIHRDSEKFADLQIGDLVRVGETKPISKNKRWEIVEVLKKVSN